VNDYTFADSVFVESSPEKLYDLVADVTRMGQWSPICTGCWWDEGDSAQVGAHFTGRNETPTRTWETRCEVVAAERGTEFAFVVGAQLVSWAYTFAAEGTGTRLTESWAFLPAGLDRFQTRYGATAQDEIDNRIKAAHEGIPATLAAIKQAAETS
jgi:ribosome-associated toxin RatA of RatAB toxin-antitoxin module